MTPHAKLKMYDELGALLLTDYIKYNKSHKNQREYENVLNNIIEIQKSNSPLSLNDYTLALKNLNDRYPFTEQNYNPHNVLCIKYDTENEALFYFQIHTSLQNDKQSTSLQTFIENIAFYKDINTEDFIFMTESSNDFPRKYTFRFWSISPKVTKEVHSKRWNKKLRVALKM